MTPNELERRRRKFCSLARQAQLKLEALMRVVGGDGVVNKFTL